MSEALTTQLSFEDKMMARIKESMGDLMTDEQLRGILEKGVEKAFFERPFRVDSYGRKTEHEPALAEKAVRDHLNERMQATVKEWIAANPEKMQEVVQQMIDKGLVQAVAGAVGNVFRGSFQCFVDHLQNQINSLR